MSLATTIAPPFGPLATGLGLARPQGALRVTRVSSSSSAAAPLSQKLEDGDLVRRALAGEEHAFRQLVERYQERAFWVARGMLGNAEDARDVAQEAFLRVHRSLARFDTQRKFYTWLYQIVVNLCIDHMRKGKKRKGVALDSVGDVAGPEAGPCSLEGQELKARVARTLDALPPKYKAVMVLSDLQGIGAKDIAEMTGTTHATVRWRHHKARKLFREAWERVYGKGSHHVV